MACSNNKKQLEKNLLKNYKVAVLSCFQRYRNLVNSNPQFRGKFFGYLKKEILKSLDGVEKCSLLREIQNNIYSNEVKVYPIDTVTPNYSIVNPSYQMNSFVPYQCSSNDQRFDCSMHQYEIPARHDHVEGDRSNENDDSFENWKLFEDSVTSRSTEPSAGSVADINNVDSLPNSISISVEDLSDSEDERPVADDFENGNNDNENISVIKQLFNEITEMIKKNERVVKKLQNIRSSHGNRIYEEVLNYVPRSGTDVTNKSEPIIFQLALKIDTYELALDHIYESKLLNLNMSNQYKMSIYNILLFTSLECLCKFLVYIKNKNLKNSIKYIYSTNEELYSLWTEQTERLKNLSISGSQEDDGKAPHAIVNGTSRVEDSRLNCLTQNFSGFLRDIDAIFKSNPSVIVDGSFFVMMAELNINKLFNFLERFLTVYTIEKHILSKSFRCQKYNGKTVASIIERNSLNEFEKSAKFIMQFINKYKDPLKNDQIPPKKK